MSIRIGDPVRNDAADTRPLFVPVWDDGARLIHLRGCGKILMLCGQSPTEPVRGPALHAEPYRICEFCNKEALRARI
jgi:hypothetical protein